MAIRSVLLFLLPLASYAARATAHYYVAPHGSDSCDGSRDSPFATLTRAQKEVRKANNKLSADLYVHVRAGTYYLDEPLNFTAIDSGSNGYRVVWQAETQNGGVNISGGIPLTNWTSYDTSKGIWKSATPIGLESRHFFADQQHAQRARQALNRTWLTNVTDGYQVVNPRADFLLTLQGVEHGEIRGIGSFTDRYIPIDSVGPNNTLIMAQPAFQNNIIGYDTITEPNVDEGFFIENVMALLDEDNEYYLNSSTGELFYKPPANVNIDDMYLVLAKLEQLLLVSGTYDAPVHDITFQGFNYMHTTWNYPSTNVGYADQQTGGYIGLNQSYTIFESSRPFWWQVPGSVQASAATNITFANGSMAAIMGGFGIGNDPNAHSSGVGLGAKDIEISGMFFTQTGTNSITIGGIQADAHHPNDTRMVNANNKVLENVFNNTAITYTSGAGLLVTYNNGSEISRNDLANLPYSGICYGYGWGSNDAGGSPEYAFRGLYNYQPLYQTPTTQMNGIIQGNAVRNYGQMHFDLGGIYTLSASPNTFGMGNYVSSPNGTGIYHDEGSRYYVDSDSVFDVGGNYDHLWWQPNESTNSTTGNLTAFDIAVALPSPLENGTNTRGDNVYNISQYSTLGELSAALQSVVYEAGIPPAQRSTRLVNYNPAPPPY